ncbi:MAG: hypothetical protein AVDCRST_MAG09-840, partial [uncultured Sphingomonas sp.]
DARQAIGQEDGQVRRGGRVDRHPHAVHRTDHRCRGRCRLRLLQEQQAHGRDQRPLL